MRGLARLALLSLPLLTSCSSSSPAATPAAHPEGGAAPSRADGAADGAGFDVYTIPPAWTGEAPVLLGASYDAIAIAIDGGYVYWQTPSGAVYASPLAVPPNTMGTELSTLVGATSQLTTLSAEAGTAYFLTGAGAVASVAYASPNATNVVYQSPAGASLGALVTDTSQAYFTETITGDAGGGNSVTVYACPLAGCTSPKTLYSTSASDNDQVFLDNLAVAGGAVYFVLDDYNDNVAKILGVPVGGGAPVTVCSSEELTSLVSLVVAGGFAYFTTSDAPATIYECPTSGSQQTATRYVEDYAPYGLASDGTNLYWTNYVPTTGTVVTCNLGATCTTPATVASNVDAPYAIVANVMSIFWTTPTTVYRADR